jgi:lysozyme family protein
MAVQHGVNQGVKLLQRAMWAAAMQKDIIQDDGLLGHETLLKLNSQTNQAMLLPALMAERAGYVRMLAAKYPTDGRFLNGWLNRCYRI